MLLLGRALSLAAIAQTFSTIDTTAAGVTADNKYLGAPVIHVVTTHFRETLTWVPHVLDDHPRAVVFIYTCGVAPLKRAIEVHPRVVLRDKRGKLAKANHFYSFFDHVVQSYGSLAQYTLFLHSHITAHHRSVPTREVVAQCHALVATTAGGIDFANVGDSLNSNWAGCERMQRAAGAVRHAAEPELGRCLNRGPCYRTGRPTDKKTARILRQTMDVGELGGATPKEIVELNGAEALVHRCRLRSRPVAYWERLRDFSINATIGAVNFHARITYMLEAVFSRLMGEPWVRPLLADHAAMLNYEVCARHRNTSSAAATAAAGGRHTTALVFAKRQYTLMPGGVASPAAATAARVGQQARLAAETWRQRWRAHTELALSLRGDLPARKYARCSHRGTSENGSTLVLG